MTIRPLRVAVATVDSEVGELQDLLGSASLVSGNGPSQGFLPVARMFGLRQMRAITYLRIHRRMGVAYACLPFGHLWWPSRRKFRRFGGPHGVGRAQNSRVFFKLGRTYRARFAAVKAL
jgi:hypothetical protein